MSESLDPKRPPSEAIEDESITVTTTYVNVLVIDARRLGDSIIHMYNTDATVSFTYKIYASLKSTDAAPADADDSWINILRDPDVDDSDAANYDHNREKTIPALKHQYESFSNKMGWVRVQMKVASGTLVAKAWHRGANN